MKVLLVATNRERAPFPVAPLGALCVAAAARAAGHEVRLLDLAFEANPNQALRRALAGGTVQAVGFSIRNLDNCSWLAPHSYFKEVRELTTTARHHCRGPLILGGSGFSVAPGGWLERLGADVGVVGEGERAFVTVLARLETSKPLTGIPGVITAGIAAATGTPAEAIEDLAALPPPAHELCHYGRYLRRGGFVSIQTKRGCPFGCIYCVYPQIEGRRYRLRPPEAVVDEVEAVTRTARAHDFFFVDSVFNDPPAHALAVCAALERRRLPIRWMAFCTPLGFSGELARAMVRAGGIGVEFGLDAASEKMLMALRKPFGQRDIHLALQAARDAILPCAVHLLFGGPGETWRDAEEAQRFLTACAPVNGVFASFGLRVYAGTALAAIAAREGGLPHPLDLFNPSYYVSPEMTGRDPVFELDRLTRQRPEWSSPVDWRRPVMRGMQKIMNFCGVRPQWKNVRNYGLHLRR